MYAHKKTGPGFCAQVLLTASRKQNSTCFSRCMTATGDGRSECWGRAWVVCLPRRAAL